MADTTLMDGPSAIRESFSRVVTASTAVFPHRNAGAVSGTAAELSNAGLGQALRCMLRLHLVDYGRDPGIVYLRHSALPVRIQRMPRGPLILGKAGHLFDQAHLLRAASIPKTDPGHRLRFSYFDG